MVIWTTHPATLLGFSPCTRSHCSRELQAAAHAQDTQDPPRARRKAPYKVQDMNMKACCIHDHGFPQVSVYQMNTLLFSMCCSQQDNSQQDHAWICRTHKAAHKQRSMHQWRPWGHHGISPCDCPQLSLLRPQHQLQHRLQSYVGLLETLTRFPCVNSMYSRKTQVNLTHTAPMVPTAVHTVKH